MGTHDLHLRLAQIAEREGQRHKAAGLYAQSLCGDPYLVEAWWGLSQTVCDPEHALYCLKRVLTLAPHHTQARQHLNQAAAHVMLDYLESEDVIQPSITSLNTPIFA
jgi:tetratricopeptide (TPR) repeat protein